MSYKLKKDNPLYGKEGCIISSRTYSLLPDKHKDLFISSTLSAFEQFEQNLQNALGDHINRIEVRPRAIRYRAGFPIAPENNVQEVEEVHHDDDDDDFDDFDLDMLEEDFEDDDDEEDF